MANALPGLQPAASISGTVTSGNAPLPGVVVIANNEQTGKHYSTTTNIHGGYRLLLPDYGKYQLSTEFTGFAPATEVVTVSGNHSKTTINFSLILTARAKTEVQVPNNHPGRTGETSSELSRSVAATKLRLSGSSEGMIQAGGLGGEDSGAELPSIASDSEFSNESVAVNGQNGSVNPLTGIDFQQIRQSRALEQEAGGEGSMTSLRRSLGLGGGMKGGGGHRNFRNFNPDQPHGAFYWTGGNGALNAEDFALRGQPIQGPAYGNNRFGAAYLGPPYIPGILTHDRSDFLFIALSNERSTAPFDEYGTVPTAAERSGDFSDLTTQSGKPITIYDPATGQPFSRNTIPADRISPQANALLQYVPLPNLSGQVQNYQHLAAAGTNTTRFAFRYDHSFGATGGAALLGMLRRYLGRRSPGQSFNIRYNYQHITSDELNLFPDFGGKDQVRQNSLQLGYSLGIRALTSKFTVEWNRTDTQLSNQFTNTTDIAAELGLAGLSSNPELYGLPDITLNQFSSFSEQQPNFQVNQTLSFSDLNTLSIGKHNLSFGGDIRRADLDMLGETNATGDYVFTGIYTEARGSGGASGVSDTGAGGTPDTGSSMADFLLGLPQQTSIQAPYQKSYLHENVWDLYAQDSWQALGNFTLLYGLRYDYYSPYFEQNNRLATLDTGNDFASVATVLPNQSGPYGGYYPHGLVYPDRSNFSPRIGLAWLVARNTVLRAGYGINYAVGQYAKFVQDFAFQPPFADVQTNEATAGAPITLANGFLSAQAEGNYAVNKFYRLPYVQVWNLNLQRTIPWDIVLNFGYTGSKGTHLDLVDAPGRTATASLSGVYYDYDNSIAFSNYNAFVFSARKRLTHGISMQARYTYSHSIDDASSVGAVGMVVAQNWQNLLAEESNSSFDIRNQLVGSFIYELPFGPYKHLLTTGWLSQTLDNVSISGTFDFSSGTSLTPHYAASVKDVARGSTGSLRPDRVPGVSLMAGGGSLTNWFNKNAFAAPADVYGTASRYSIPGPGSETEDMSLSKTIVMGSTRSIELRATADNIFNTVQYSGVDTTLGSGSYGQVTSTAPMRQFTFVARFRY